MVLQIRGNRLLTTMLLSKLLTMLVILLSNETRNALGDLKVDLKLDLVCGVLPQLVGVEEDFKYFGVGIDVFQITSPKHFLAFYIYYLGGLVLVQLYGLKVGV